MRAKRLKDHLTPDDGHEIWSVAHELRVLARETRGVVRDRLKFQATRLERLARIADQQQMPLEYSTTEAVR